MVNKLENKLDWKGICDYVMKTLLTKKQFENKKEVLEFQEWFMSREDVGFRFDAFLIYRCFKICKWLADDKDHFITIVGKEGEGKSTIAIQIASWIQGSSFDVSRVCLQTEDYLNALHKDTKGTALVLDEVILQLFSRKSMSAGSKNMAQLFFIMRCKNICTISCLPNLKYADSVLKSHRTKTLIIVPKRGHYKAVVGRGVEIITNSLKKRSNINSIPIPYGCFHEGHFRKEYPKNISKEDYDKRKNAGVDNYIKQIKEELNLLKFVSVKTVCNATGLGSNKIRGMIKSGELEGKQMGGKFLVTKKAFDKLLET